MSKCSLFHNVSYHCHVSPLCKFPPFSSSCFLTCPSSSCPPAPQAVPNDQEFPCACLPDEVMVSLLLHSSLLHSFTLIVKSSSPPPTNTSTPLPLHHSAPPLLHFSNRPHLSTSTPYLKSKKKSSSIVLKTLPYCICTHKLPLLLLLPPTHLYFPLLHPVSGLGGSSMKIQN